MPTFRKLLEAEVAPAPPLSPRAEVAQAYDALLAGFVAGEWGEVALGVGEVRPSVRQRLQAAAKRRGLALRFRPGPGPLLFRVETAAPLPAAPPAACPPSGQQPDPPAAPPSQAQRRPRGERRAAGRYDDVLPRWMREGEKGRRGR